MQALRPVLWTKGTLLTPQHLQLQDRYLEGLLQSRLESLVFRPWGFSHLQLSHEALASGAVAIQSARGFFADGLPFDIPERDAAPPAKPLAEFFEAGQEAVNAYLAVPEYRSGGVNVSVAGSAKPTRYVAEVHSFADENTGTAGRMVQVAAKNLRLLAEGENRQGYALLRIARVLRSDTGTFQFDPLVAPPLIGISASSHVMMVARRLLEILAAKSSMLAGLRRQKNQSLAEFTASDIANFWLLYSINTHLPRLRHVFEMGHSHPEELFSVMLSLASVLTTFSLEIQPRDLPVYDHEELGACLGELDDKLQHLLATVVPSNFVSLALKLIQPSIYATSLSDDKYLSGTRMYLAIRAAMDEAELIQKGPQLIKACSATHVEHLVRQALPGVTLLHAETPPGSIPLKLNYQYFSLSQSGLAWEAIVRARNFAVYVPGDFPEPQLELIILLPGE